MIGRRQHEIVGGARGPDLEAVDDVEFASDWAVVEGVEVVGAGAADVVIVADAAEEGVGAVVGEERVCACAGDRPNTASTRKYVILRSSVMASC